MWMGYFLIREWSPAGKTKGMKVNALFPTNLSLFRKREKVCDWERLPGRFRRNSNLIRSCTCKRAVMFLLSLSPSLFLFRFRSKPPIIPLKTIDSSSTCIAFLFLLPLIYWFDPRPKLITKNGEINALQLVLSGFSTSLVKHKWKCFFFTSLFTTFWKIFPVVKKINTSIEDDNLPHLRGCTARLSRAQTTPFLPNRKILSD